LSVFEYLNYNLKNKLKEFGFITPTGPQIKAIPKILKGHNSLIVAPTGSGKTEAAIFPVISKILDLKKSNPKYNGIKALYITPLKSLNRDIFKRLIQLAESLSIKIEVRHGDTPTSTRRKQALKPPDILIITPETLQAILPGKRMQEHLKAVKWVIVDEIHELANDKRGAQLAIGLERLVLLSRRRFQRIGLSATVGNVAKVAKFLVGVNEKVKIIYFSGRKHYHLVIDYTDISDEDKKTAVKLNSTEIIAKTIKLISEIITKHRSVLLFTNTRATAEIIASKLMLYNPEFEFAVHHGSLSREVRLEAETKFKNETIKCVICTSSLELGIDIGSIDFVIQFMSPRQVSKLIQRMGRSGHKLGETSEGYIITINTDDILESLAIARNMQKNRIEEIVIQENCLDVLCNQIAGILLDVGEINREILFKIVKKAYPFRELSYDQFLSVLDYIREQRIAWIDGDRIKRGGNTLTYYYSNLSMIPDVRQFTVIDITSNKKIGTLDEEFVVTNDIGTVFIAKGQAWKVLAIEEELVKVQPIPHPSAAVPSWEGELMPVPYSIAQNVGVFRSEIMNMLERYNSDTPGVLKLRDRLLTNNEENNIKLTRQALRKLLESHIVYLKNKIPVATEKLIVIEVLNNLTIIHSCFGSKVNETIGYLIGALLSTKYGETVAVKTDPYRIIIQHQKRIPVNEIKAILTNTETEHVSSILEIVLKQTTLFRWKYTYVAKRFGLIEKNAEYHSIDIKRLIRFANPVIFDETMREILTEKLDVKRTREILSRIKKGEISIETYYSPKENILGEYTEIALDSLKSRSLVQPERPVSEILETLKRRIYATQKRLICLYCGKSLGVKSINSIEEKPRCPKCGSRYITVTYPTDSESISLIKRWKSGEKLTKNEEKEIKKLQQIGSLVLSMGKKAIIILAGRGIGLTTAKRIIAKTELSEDELFKAILRAEKQYVETRGFWE